MAITAAAFVKTAMMTTMRDSMADGTLELLSAANQVLAVFGLSSTGGTISGSTWTVALDSSGSTVGTAASGAGTVATSARIKSSGGAVGLSGFNVGLTGSGADFQFDNVSISEGQTVNLTSGTIAW